MQTAFRCVLSVGCVVALAMMLSAAPAEVGRDVALSEAAHVQGAVVCGGPSTTQSVWCSIECTWFCLSTSCASCGCLTTCDPGGTGWTQNTTPCGTAGCGGRYLWLNTCGGS